MRSAVRNPAARALVAARGTVGSLADRPVGTGRKRRAQPDARPVRHRNPRAWPDPRTAPCTCARSGARRRPARPCASWTARAWTVTHRRGRSGRCAAPDVLPLAGSARPHGDDARRDRNGPTRPDEGDAAPGWPPLPTAGPGASTWSTRPSPGNISRRNARGLHPVTRDRGRRATSDNPLAHVAFEADGRRDGGALTVRLWPHAPEPETLARADFHGRWVDWLG
jgi:hypothetical protein